MSTGTAVRPRRRHELVQLALLILGVLLLIALLVDRIVLHGSNGPGAGSGVAATQARSLPRFTGLDLAGANNVVVRVGGRQSVVVHADRNLLGRVTTEVRSRRLVIGTTPGSLNARAPMYVTVSVPSLDHLTLSGAGNISVSGIDSRSLTVALPGSGTIHVAGTTAKLRVTISGEGTALLRELIARDAKAVLDGDGTIMLTVTHDLGARVSGTGAVLYGGSPARVTQAVTGSGTISPG